MSDRTDAALLAVAKFKRGYEKKHGRPIILGLAKDIGIGEFSCISTGVLGLDVLLSGGITQYPGKIGKRAGWIRGKYSCIEGPSSAGKTTTAYRSIASAQADGQAVAYVNVEHSYDPTWAAANGVDTEKLIGGEFENAEDGLNFIRDIGKTKTLDLLVYDSIVGIGSIAEMETKSGGDRDLTDDSMALIPRVLSQFFRMTTAVVARSNMAVLFTNQVRAEIGTYGTPERGPGGHALRHYLSNRVTAKRTGATDTPEWADKSFTFTISKSNTGAIERDKIAVPFFERSGFDNDATIILLAYDMGLLPHKTDEDGKVGLAMTYTDKAGAIHTFRSKNTLVERAKEAGIVAELSERIRSTDVSHST